MRVRRQTVEHPFGKSLDGIDALPHENAQARQHRGGAACLLGLQHETGDAHSERWRIDGSDPDRRQAAPAILSVLPNHKTPRSYTALYEDFRVKCYCNSMSFVVRGSV
jgi:hypothetical protein